MAMSDVHAEIAATKSAMAGLKLAVLSCVGGIAGHTSKASAGLTMADELRCLDSLYTAHHGSPLIELNAPLYLGPLYQWTSSREDVTRCAVQAVIRLRRSFRVGVHMITHFRTLNYFASIWPSDLEWPRDIPRPPKSKKEAA